MKRVHAELTFSKVFTHSMLFGVQSVVFTMQNAIFHNLFVLMGIQREDEQETTSTIVGYIIGSFFLGKMFSDPVWGIVRDKIGDKYTLSIIAACTFVTMSMMGSSKSLIFACISTCLVGFSSGMYVPGTSFINWAEPTKRDYLAMWIYIASAAGALIGPFIGSALINFMPNPKVFLTYFSVGVAMVLFTLWFLYEFWNYDDSSLIVDSEYSRLEEDEAILNMYGESEMKNLDQGQLKTSRASRNSEKHRSFKDNFEDNEKAH